jgi:2-methylcitrate dehydratase PrpD
MSSWSVVLDYDDVMLGGHTGHSSVLVPWALGSAGGFSGAEILLAQIVANEIAARINMVCAVGPARGQMATHLHLAGAAAARAKLEGLDEETFAEALGLALSYPSKALYPAFLGSDAKAFCAGIPVRAGMEAVEAARQGLRAAPDLLDAARGFFATHATFPVREFLGGLGEQWHTETNSFKLYPVCGYICGALDAALDLTMAHDLQPRDIEAVDVWASLFAVGMDELSAPYIDGPRSRISTLTFYTPFAVASAILAREFTPEQLKRAWIADPRVWDLAARVRTRHDPRLTARALTADIPIGAALRRTRRWQAAVFGWSAAGTAFGRMRRWRTPDAYGLVARLAAAAGEKGPLDLTNSTKPMGARVEIRLANGSLLRSEVSIPRAFAGSGGDGRGATVRDLMRKKFATAAATVVGPESANDAASAIENLDQLSSAEVMRLLESASLRFRARAV